MCQVFWKLRNAELLTLPHLLAPLKYPFPQKALPLNKISTLSTLCCGAYWYEIKAPASRCTDDSTHPDFVILKSHICKLGGKLAYTSPLINESFCSITFFCQMWSPFWYMCMHVCTFELFLWSVALLWEHLSPAAASALKFTFAWASLPGRLTSVPDALGKGTCFYAASKLLLTVTFSSFVISFYI